MSDKQELTTGSKVEISQAVAKQASKEDLYYALINQEEQYSLWPDYKAIPDGWKAKFGPMPKDECMAYVNKVWTDMRPLSLRIQMAQLQSENEVSKTSAIGNDQT